MSFIINPYIFAASNGLLNNLVSYYEFEGDVTDSHGSNNGTDNGTSDITGKIGQGRDFDGTNDYITLPNILTLDNDFTINFWFNSDVIGDSTNHWVWTGRGTREIDIRFRNTTNNLEFSMVDGTGTNEVSIPVGDMSSNTWYMCTCTRDKTNGMEIFLNNISKDTNSFTGNANSIATGNFLGRINSGSGLYYNGTLDEAGFWSTVLTSAQRTALLNGGTGLAYSGFTS